MSIQNDFADFFAGDEPCSLYPCVGYPRVHSTNRSSPLKDCSVMCTPCSCEACKARDSICHALGCDNHPSNNP